MCWNWVLVTVKYYIMICEKFFFFQYISQDSCGPNPCQNGGTCNRDDKGSSGYTCECDGGFSGRNCEDGKTALSAF